jgi:hypothetical protein
LEEIAVAKRGRSLVAEGENFANLKTKTGEAKP